VNGVDLGDSLGANGRGGLAFGSGRGKTVLSSTGAVVGTGNALVTGERERFRSLEASDSKPFSCELFGSSFFSSFDLQFSSIELVSICVQIVLESMKRTVSGTAPAAVWVGGVTTICHRNFVLLIDVAAPHTFRIHPGIGATTEGAPQARLLTLRPGLTPAFLKVLFLCRTPPPRRLKLSRIWDSIWVGVRRRGEVLWVQKPVFVVRHYIVGETLGILLSVRETCERRVEEDRIGVSRRGVHRIHNVS